MFLPNDVLAEKNEPNGKQNFLKDVQADPSVEINIPVAKPDISDKQKTVIKSELPSKNQSGEKQQETPNHSVSQNPAAVLQKLPEQAKEHVKSALDKDKKPAKTPASIKNPAVQGDKNGLEKNKPASKSMHSRAAALNSLQLSEPEVMIQDHSVKSVPQDKAADSKTVVTKEDPSESIEQKSEKNGEKPLDKEELPKASQSQNPTQRTSSNGGSSNDRTNFGFNTISFLDKWFALNPYYDIQLVQTYQSRYIWLNNQWVNAPPSPPPQEALFLETVTRS